MRERLADPSSPAVLEELAHWSGQPTADRCDGAIRPGEFDPPFLRFASLAQSDRAPAYGADGRRFESSVGHGSVCGSAIGE